MFEIPKLTFHKIGWTTIDLKFPKLTACYVSWYFEASKCYQEPWIASLQNKLLRLRQNKQTKHTHKEIKDDFQSLKLLSPVPLPQVPPQIHLSPYFLIHQLHLLYTDRPPILIFSSKFPFSVKLISAPISPKSTGIHPIKMKPSEDPEDKLLLQSWTVNYSQRFSQSNQRPSQISYRI